MDDTGQLGPMRHASPLDILVRAVATGGHACTYCEPRSGMAPLLDRAATDLPSFGIRVVRTGSADPRGLDLPELVAQIARQWPREIGGDDQLERAFLTLTVPGSGFTQVALLVDDADRKSVV